MQRRSLPAIANEPIVLPDARTCGRGGRERGRETLSGVGGARERWGWRGGAAAISSDAGSLPGAVGGAPLKGENSGVAWSGRAGPGRAAGAFPRLPGPSQHSPCVPYSPQLPPSPAPRLRRAARTSSALPSPRPAPPRLPASSTSTGRRARQQRGAAGARSHGEDGCRRRRRCRPPEASPACRRPAGLHGQLCSRV